MKLLEDRIRRDGVVKEGNVLKVDRFLNHQMDIELFQEIGKEFKRRFANENVNKILTIEASGIGIACRRPRQKTLPERFTPLRWSPLPMEESMTSSYPKNF